MNMMEAAASEPSLDLDNLKLLEVRLHSDYRLFLFFFFSVHMFFFFSETVINSFIQ